MKKGLFTDEQMLTLPVKDIISIARARKEQPLRYLAEESGMSPTEISLIERGVLPRHKTIAKLAKPLNLDLDMLVLACKSARAMQNLDRNVDILLLLTKEAEITEDKALKKRLSDSADELIEKWKIVGEKYGLEIQTV